MQLEIKTDHIVSYGNDFALITNIQPHPEIKYYYEATLTENRFPFELVELCSAFYECVDAFSMVLVDEIEDEIKQYQLRLKQSNTKIFDLEIKADRVSFFIKYPTSKGFLDDYPE